MSPPIFNPDGPEVNEIVLPDGATASEVIGPDGNVVFEAGPDIPDSVVNRPTDNVTGDPSNKNGVQIETSVEWPEIGAKISSNSSGFTTAYVYRISDATLLGQNDVSSLTAGDTFTISLSNNLIPGETYNFVLDAGGSQYAQGLYDSPTFPYTSPDGNLEIVAGAANETDSNTNLVSMLVEVGNVGFA